MILGALIAVALSAPPAGLVAASERSAFEAVVRTAALEADAKYGGAQICAEASVEPLSVELIKIPGHPDIKAARVRVRVNGCGRSSVENVNAIRLTGTPPWRMLAGAPGESLADVGLQQNLWPIVLAAAGAQAPKGCQSHQLDDVYVAARPGQVTLPGPGESEPAVRVGKINIRLAPQAEAERAKLDVARAWVEVWPLKMCGLDRTQAILIVPLRDKGEVFHLEIPMWKMVERYGPTAIFPPAPAD